MAPVKISYIVSFSSQDDYHKASNIVSSDGSKCWLSSRTERSGKIEIVLQLDEPSQLAYIDIGAIWCANLEVRVGRSDWPQSMEFKSLIPSVSLMTPIDCRLSRATKSTQMFSKKDFAEDVAREKWDRLQIICRQPYRKDVQFGLSFVSIKSVNTIQVSPQTKEAESKDLAEGKRSVDNILSIKNHFFGDSPSSNNEGHAMLKHRLLKIAGSAENGSDLEQTLSRTAKLVLKATENSIISSPQHRMSPKLPRRGLFSEHQETKKHDILIEDEIKAFLPTLNFSALDLDKVTVADLRHKFERKKRQKLSQEERKTFSELCQTFISDLFEDIGEETGSYKTSTFVEAVDIKQKQRPSNDCESRLLKQSEKEQISLNKNQTSGNSSVRAVCDDSNSQATSGSGLFSMTKMSGQSRTIPASLAVKLSQASPSLSSKDKSDRISGTMTSPLLTLKKQSGNAASNFSFPQGLNISEDRLVQSESEKFIENNGGKDKSDKCKKIGHADSLVSVSCDQERERTDTSCTPGNQNAVQKTALSHNSDHNLRSTSSPPKRRRLSKESLNLLYHFNTELLSSDEEKGDKTSDPELKVAAPQTESPAVKSDSARENSERAINSNSKCRLLSSRTPKKSQKQLFSKTASNSSTPKSVKGKVYRMYTSRSKDCQNNDSSLTATINRQSPQSLKSSLSPKTNEGRSVAQRATLSTSKDVPNWQQYKNLNNSETQNLGRVDRGKKRRNTNQNALSTSSNDDSADHNGQGRSVKAKEQRVQGRGRERNSTSLSSDFIFCDKCFCQYPSDNFANHYSFCMPPASYMPGRTLQGSHSSEMLIDEDMEYGECPICLQKFPQDVLLVHASDCGI